MLRRTVLRTALHTVMQASLYTLLGAGRSFATAPALRLAVFADYNVQAVLDEFTEHHHIPIELVVFDSNEELLTACVRGEHFDLLTLSHYMVPHFAALGLLSPVSPTTITAIGSSHWNRKLADFGQLDQRWLALPKNYGTTGFVYRSSKLPALSSWQEFWEALPGKASRHCSVIEDVQTLIGAALCYYGYSINSTRPEELLKAEQLLLRSRPHLRALVGDVDNAVLKSGDWLAMAWSDSGYSLSNSDADIRFVNPRDGGELWCDFYGIGAATAQPDVAEALLQWLLQPAQIAREVIALGVSPVDDRVLALLPDAVRQNAIVFPERSILAAIEMSSQEALREPLRAEIFARFAATF